MEAVRSAEACLTTSSGRWERRTRSGATSPSGTRPTVVAMATAGFLRPSEGDQQASRATRGQGACEKSAHAASLGFEHATERPTPASWRGAACGSPSQRLCQRARLRDRRRPATSTAPTPTGSTGVRLDPPGDALHINPDETSGESSNCLAPPSGAVGPFEASSIAVPASATSIGSLPTGWLPDDDDPPLDDATPPLDDLAPDEEENPLLDDDPPPDDAAPPLDEAPPLLLDDVLHGIKVYW